MNLKKQTSNFIYSSPDTLKGLPCFKGTRVPVHRVFDYLALGWSISELKKVFPSVKTVYITKLLEQVSTSFSIKRQDQAKPTGVVESDHQETGGYWLAL